MASYTPNLNLKKPAATDAADIADINGNMDLIDAAVSAILGSVYPVGSIYMSVNSTSPATLFGGTWEQIQDTFLLAAGQEYTAGNTGGEAQHTLTENELPVMTRSINFRNFYNTNNNTNLSILSGQGTDGTVNTTYSFDFNRGGVGSMNNNQTGTRLTMTWGGGQSMNNLPPYLAVYVWKRTA